MEEIDVYQERYLNHQSRKKMNMEHFDGVEKIKSDDFYKVLENRRSQRAFNEEKITDTQIKDILNAVRLSPSSCNRQAIYVKDGDKDVLEYLLVGGRNWVDKADKVLLLFGDKLAYKNPAEISFMPFLDAGVVAQSVMLMCEYLGLGSCFVNPNIRQENKEEFEGLYGKDYFCGAIAIGNYDKKSKIPPIRDLWEVAR